MDAPDVVVHERVPREHAAAILARGPGFVDSYEVFLPLVGAGELFGAVGTLDNVRAVRFRLVRVQTEFGRELQVAVRAFVTLGSVVTRYVRAQVRVGPEGRTTEDTDKIVVGMHFVHVLEHLAEIARRLFLRAKRTGIAVLNELERLYPIVDVPKVGRFVLGYEMIH